VLLRQEDLPEPFMIPGAAKAERILYSSTSGVDKTPVTVSGTLFVPEGDMPEGGWPVISFGHGTVGIADICAPSWAGRSWRDVAYISRWLSEGFAVVASDYQGIGTPGRHPYIDGPSGGYSIIDAARAIVGEGTDFSNQVVFVGQSQGGPAVLTASALAGDYAPDLNVLGTVATGAALIDVSLIADVAGTRPEIEDEPDPVSAVLLYMALALDGLPEPVPPEVTLTEKALPVLELAKFHCVYALEYDTLMADLSMKDTLTPEGWKALASQRDTLVPPPTGYTTPIFLGTGDMDIDAAPELQEAMYDMLCEGGAAVQHHIYKGFDHSTAVNESLKDSVPFVRRLMQGEPEPGTCKAQPSGQE
jgi:pimeloyl-ACP methyl ester carboxylesterase